MKLETAVKCRICRQESKTDMVALKQQVPFGNLIYAQIYDFVTGYNNVLLNGPQFLCRVCAIDLSVAYDFRTKCIKSEQIYERNPTIIKREVSEEPEMEKDEIEEENIEDSVPEIATVYWSEHETSFKNEESYSDDSYQQMDDSVNQMDEMEHNFDQMDDIKKQGCDVIKNEQISEDEKVQVKPQKTFKKRDFKNYKFNCPFCVEVFTSIGPIIDHIHYIHGGKKMECDVPGCSFVCELHFQLDKHKKTVHNPNKIKAPSKMVLNSYSKIKNDAKPSPCPFCDNFSGFINVLLNHCETVHAGKELSCPRDGCDYKYFLKYQIEHHDRLIHKIQRKAGSMFECPTCKMLFQTRTRLSNHQFEKHGIEKRPNKPNPQLKEYTLCPQCGKSLKVSSLSVHIQLVHEKFLAGSFVCDLCGNCYSTKISLTNHIKYAHLERKPNKCRYCDELFPNVPSRRYHEVRNHTHDYKYICSICDLKCYGPQNLKDHFTTHTGEKIYECDVCSKTFKRRTTLKNHLITHTEERPFDCPVCQSTFKSIKYLKSHMRVHEKPRK